MESPVLFAEAVAASVTSVPVDILVVIGPHSALQGPLRQISKNHSGKFPEYLTAILRNNDNTSDILTLAGTLFTKGNRVNLTRFNENLPWLTDHRVGQDIVFPSKGYLAMAIEAATQAVEVNGGFEEEISSYNIRGVGLQKELVIPEEDRSIEIYFELAKDELECQQ
ncbi:hypothetical protein EAF00_006681 [Botryotinia globosa]|nr:hypothetical protein EAF00_006681 [Botryotinia globosa]